MACFSGPEIVNSGIILHVDAANPRSWPGSGSTLYDISGNQNHFTVSGTPTTINSAIQFDTTSYAYNNSSDFRIGTYTFMAATRYTGGVKGRIIAANYTLTTSNWLLGHHGGQVDKFYSDGWVYNGTTYDTSWRIYTGTVNTGTDTYRFYINGNLIAESAGGSNGPNGLVINGYGSTTTERSDGQFSFLSVYNRILTSAEIQQNFEATRSRYGI